MGDPFVITPKYSDGRDDKSVTMTIRIDRELRDKYDMLSKKSQRSRNQLINMALQYALDNLKFVPEEEIDS